MERLAVKSIAVIGAGPSGLAAAKYLLAEKKFSKIQVFEQRAASGGVWNHTALQDRRQVARPRTEPCSRPDQPIYVEDDADVHFESPMYEFLETNIPQTLMNYSDFEFPRGTSLFPRHEVVLRYLQDYAKDVESLISFQTQILSIEKVKRQGGDVWDVQFKDLRTKEVCSGLFDAVVVASGHYSDQFIPDIPGLVEFDESLSGAVVHSKNYQRADSYAGKKVIVVGNSASGIDISSQLASVAKLPILISEKTSPNAVVEGPPWSEHVPEIVEFLPQQRAVRFSNGRIEGSIDAVIFCTGFHYSFPFLRRLSLPVQVPDGSHAAHLWEHMIYTADPTLAFIAIPQRIVPFPVAEAQGAVVARAWAGRLDLPARAQMEAWVETLRLERGETKALHNLAFPRDVDYINSLHRLSMTARKASPDLGLENDGDGKTPPYWGEEKAWVRQRIPQIKMASRALGSRRHEVKSLDDLGFSYEEWKRLLGGSW